MKHSLTPGLNPFFTHRAAFALAVFLGGSGSLIALDQPVSPGGLDDITPVASACPVFSWATDSLSGIELMVTPYLMPEETLLREELPTGALTWTPPADRCLQPGQYMWFFRSLDVADGEWSDALSFEVSPLPSLEEVKRARLTLDNFIQSGGATSSTHVIRNGKILERKTSIAGASPAANPNVPYDSPTISGGVIQAIPSIPEGGPVSSAALTGLTSSADAAGVRAGNSGGGADLVLDGGVQAQISENTWQLESANPQTFDFSNPSGDLSLRVNGEEVLTGASPAAGEPVSMFGAFGGNGTTDHTVAGTENLNSSVAYFRNLDIPAGATLVVTQPVTVIAVSETCDIEGTIVTTGAGHSGGLGAQLNEPSPGAPGWSAAGAGSGYGMHGGMHRLPVPMAIAGAAGGGGGTGDAPLERGGDGGGAESFGGEGGYPEFGVLHGRTAGVDWEKRHLMTAGATDDIAFPPGDLVTDFFMNFIYFPGAGGGGGASAGAGSTGGDGGNGAGNVYLECRTASFTGTFDVRGGDGVDGMGIRAGAGGGGGGGIGVIRTLQLLQNSGDQLVNGGVGGTGVGGGGNGGHGRRGVIEIVEL